MPPTCGAEIDSCIRLLCIRPIFFPETMATAMVMVTTPIPPIWISSRITTCPKQLQYVAVSWTISPVTQVADVAVNNASRNGALPGSLDAKGSIKSSVPTNITAKKPNIMI
jgi:hypothetical protein